MRKVWLRFNWRLGLGCEGSRQWDIKEFLNEEVLRIKGHRIERVDMEVLVEEVEVLVVVQELSHGEEVSLVQVEEVLWLEVEKRLRCGGRFEGRLPGCEGW
ncbi:hypothetical protein ACLOJK_037629 [Asimina triloba]